MSYMYVGQHIPIGGEQRAKIKASGKLEKLNQKENIRKWTNIAK